MMATTLAQEIQALLQSLPEVIPEARGLPAIAPQSVQSGGRPAPAPNAIGRRHQDERAPVPIQQTAQEFGDAATGFAASAADPLGIPSALLGMVAPQARDAWRGAQGAGGMGPQLAGGILSGYGAVNALMRGGSAIAGIPGMIAGGAATGAGPAIDYAAGAPGASVENALLSPAVGAMLPAMGPIGNLIRQNPGTSAGAAGLGGLAVLGNAGDDASAQQKKKAPAARPVQPAAPEVPPLPPLPELTAQERLLHERDPELAALYQVMVQARAAAEQARRVSVEASAGPTGNSGARGISERADTAFTNAQTAYTKKLGVTGAATQAASPSFRDYFGPVIGNPLVGQFGLPLAAGAFIRGGGAALARRRNAMTNESIAGGNTALAGGNVPLAAQHSADANAMLRTTTSPSRWDGAANLAAGAGAGEIAAFAPHVWDKTLPVGLPARKAADEFFADPMQVATQFGRGLLGGMAGYKLGNALMGAGNNYLGGANLIPPQGAANSLATRVQQAQQQPPPPPPPPPYRGQFRTDFQNTVATAVENTSRRRPFDPASLLGSIEVSAHRRPLLERALAQVQSDLAAASTAAERAAIAQRVRSGGYPNLVVTGAAAGAAAHHSLAQPRGDDGRFVGEDP